MDFAVHCHLCGNLPSSKVCSVFHPKSWVRGSRSSRVSNISISGRSSRTVHGRVAPMVRSESSCLSRLGRKRRFRVFFICEARPAVLRLPGRRQTVHRALRRIQGAATPGAWQRDDVSATHSFLIRVLLFRVAATPLTRVTSDCTRTPTADTGGSFGKRTLRDLHAHAVPVGF